MASVSFEFTQTQTRQFTASVNFSL